MPRSIDALVDETRRRLPDSAQRVLQQAAVLGERVDPALLARVIEEPPSLVIGALAAARDAGLLVELRDRPLPLRFRHALTREAILRGMLDAQCALTHERAAIVLESVCEDDRNVEALAYHWWEAGNRAKVREYSERAGDTAFALTSYDDARLHFERALDVASSNEGRASLLCKIGHAERAAGRSARATERYATAFDLFRALGDENGAAGVVPFLAVERSNAGESFAKVARFLADAQASFGRRVDGVLLARLRIVRAQFLVFAGEIDAALAAIEDVDLRLPLPPQLRTVFWTVRMVVYYRRNETALCLQAADASADVRVATDASSRINVATCAFGLGATKRARDEIDEAVDVARRWRFGTALAHALFVRAYIAYVCGRAIDARRDVDEALELEIESIRAEATFVAPLVALARGDVHAATRTFDADRAERESGDASSDQWQKISAVSALLAHAGGHRERAREIALEGVATLSGSYAAAATLPIAASLVDAGDEGAIVEAALRVFGETTRPAAATMALVRAIFAARRGDAATALRLGTGARAAYDDIGWNLLAAIAVLCEGEVESARARFDAMGAPGEWRRWSALLSGGRAPAAPRSLLSPRERAVAELVADGASNASIALRCGISRKTVEKHVASIFEKLGVRSRAQVGAFVATQRAGVE
ncbi:MAG: LuxR C-terminal-related transcriptional regulator [Candidatus Tyrphobacter sp.]